MIGSFRLPIVKGKVADYVRPADWLEIDSLVNEGDEKFVGLHLITEDSNFLSLSAAGAYTVNWGDGVIEDYASGIQSYHIYDWNDFVGTDTERGYRQAIVTVTPQVAGTFININLQRKHNQAGLQAYAGGWLDIVMAGENFASWSIGGTIIPHRNLEQFQLKGTHNVTSMQSMFQNCLSLQSVPLFNTALVTTMQNMFQNCYSLQTVPLFNTVLVTTMQNMFFGCYSLQTVPLFNTASVTSMVQMFYNCNSLQSVPLFNMVLVTTMQNMFFGCYSLQKGALNGTSSDISYQNAKLSAAALVDVFNGLATVVSQTITITGNWGADLLTAQEMAIATDKGWTIIG